MISLRKSDTSNKKLPLKSTPKIEWKGKQTQSFYGTHKPTRLGPDEIHPSLFIRYESYCCCWSSFINNRHSLRLWNAKLQNDMQHFHAFAFNRIQKPIFQQCAVLIRSLHISLSCYLLLLISHSVFCCCCCRYCNAVAARFIRWQTADFRWW